MGRLLGKYVRCVINTMYLMPSDYVDPNIAFDCISGAVSGDYILTCINSINPRKILAATETRIIYDESLWSYRVPNTVPTYVFRMPEDGTVYVTIISEHSIIEYWFRMVRDSDIANRMIKPA